MVKKKTTGKTEEQKELIKEAKNKANEIIEKIESELKKE
jgi:vacuolar-type H+-ATPase subunit H